MSYVTRLLLWIVNIIEAIPGQFVKRPVMVYEDEKPCINLTNSHTTSNIQDTSTSVTTSPTIITKAETNNSNVFGRVPLAKRLTT